MRIQSSLPQSAVVRRIAGGACFTFMALIIAHATNAFVADALHAPTDIYTQSAPPQNPINMAVPDDSQQQAEIILQSGLFALPPTVRSMKDGKPIVDEGPPPPPIEAARKVAFLGSVHGTNGSAMAILEDLTSKAQQMYRIGTEVTNIGVLQAVERDRVLFKSGPSEEWLTLAALSHQTNENSMAVVPSPRPTQATPTRQVLDRREVTAALNDPTRLMMQANAVPYLTDGKLDGFRLYNVLPAGFFNTLGLRTNDIVQRINGVELRDPGMLLSLFQQLRNENKVRIDLVRNLQRQTLTYEIR